jgi:glycosyltransferase involved in cell wall biosynthesis
MRILQFLPSRFWGGPEKQTLQLARWLRDSRAIETVIAVVPQDTQAADANPLVLRAREAGFEVTPFLQRRRYDVVEGRRLLRELVARHKPDVVCSTGYKADVLTAFLTDIPTVAVARGWTAQDAKVRFFEWLDRMSLRRHDAVTVVSNALRNEVIRAGVPPAKVFWVPNALDMGELTPPRRREAFCREIGADPQRPIVGAVGRLSPEKGHRVLLNAFAAVRDRVLKAQLVLVGDGPEESALRQVARRLELSDCTTFAGLRKDGQQIVGALDVMALPSFSEGMPNVILEAFGYGIPVVATAVGGVPDMLSDRTGWLVPPGDPGQLSAALAEALEDRPEAERRARQAQAVLSENFTVARQGLAWLQAIDAAVYAGRRRA